MSYSSEVLADNPVVYYKLNETFGTTATDYGSNGTNGTYTGTAGEGYLLARPALAQDVDNVLSVQFNPSNTTGNRNGHVVRAGTGASWPSSALTFEFWYADVKETPSNIGVFVHYASAGSVNDFRAYIISNNIAASIAGVNVSFATSANVRRGGLRHIAIVWDNSSAQCKQYVDGVLTATTNSIASGLTITSGGTLTLGVGQLSVGNPDTFRLRARMSAVAIYTTALSDARIAAHYQEGIDALSQPEVKGAYDFGYVASQDVDYRSDTENPFATFYESTEFPVEVSGAISPSSSMLIVTGDSKSPVTPQVVASFAARGVTEVVYDGEDFVSPYTGTFTRDPSSDPTIGLLLFSRTGGYFGGPVTFTTYLDDGAHPTVVSSIPLVVTNDPGVAVNLGISNETAVVPPSPAEIGAFENVRVFTQHDVLDSADTDVVISYTTDTTHAIIYDSRLPLAQRKSTDFAGGLFQNGPVPPSGFNILYQFAKNTGWPGSTITFTVTAITAYGEWSDSQTFTVTGGAGAVTYPPFLQPFTNGSSE